MSEQQAAVEMSDILEKVAFYALDEGQQKLEQGGCVVPFTVMVEGEDLFIETHPGEEVADCFGSAQTLILSAREGIDCYVFCYDGFVETEDSQRDALIVECAEKDQETGHAVGLVYSENDGEYEFDEAPMYLGTAPSFFSDEYSLPEDADDDDDDFDDDDDDFEDDSDDDESDEDEDEDKD